MGIKKVINEKFDDLYRIQNELYAYANTMRNKGMKQVDVESLPEVKEMITQVINIDRDIRTLFISTKSELSVYDLEDIAYKISCVDGIGDTLTDLSFIYDQNIPEPRTNFGPWVLKDAPE